ncbi:hypothetical protein RJ641_035976 [Dillenia turbinata]|uniref:Uncharacterized protein n=1 Tax=Dillenia turbinata TaxID=194707 RepID=A0AAN8VP29_9MAGN
MDEQPPIIPRVLIFPIPIQGDLNFMLKLAELLCLSNLHVTFLNSHHAHTRLLRFTNIQTRFNRYPGFRFETISDGLAEDHPRTGDRFPELLDAMNRVTKPLFEELLTRLVVDERESPVSCVIADGVFVFALDVAERLGIKLIFARPISPYCLWTLHRIPQLIGAGEIPLGSIEARRKTRERVLRAERLKPRGSNLLVTSNNGATTKGTTSLDDLSGLAYG